MKKWRGKVISDDYIIAALKEKAAKLGRVPTIKDILLDKKMPSESVIRKRFGSYGSALAAAKLPLNKTMNYWDREKIIEGLERFFREHNRPPYANEIDKLDYLPCHSTVLTYVGSMRQIYELLGVPYNRREMERSAQSMASTDTITIKKDRYLELLEAENQLLRGGKKE